MRRSPGRPSPMRIPESNPGPRRVGRPMAWGVAIGVGAVVLRELVRPREQPARLIDWGRVEEIALARCGEPQDLPAHLSRDHIYQLIAACLAPRPAAPPPLSGDDARASRPTGPGTVRPRSARERAGGNLIADPG